MCSVLPALPILEGRGCFHPFWRLGSFPLVLRKLLLKREGGTITAWCKRESELNI